MGRNMFGKVQSTLEFQPRLRLVKPAFIVRNDRSGADEPNPRLPLLDQYLSSGKLLAKRNLPIRANDLDAKFVFYGVHFCRALAGTVCLGCAFLPHDGTMARKGVNGQLRAPKGHSLQFDDERFDYSTPGPDP